MICPGVCRGFLCYFDKSYLFLKSFFFYSILRAIIPYVVLRAQKATKYCKGSPDKVVYLCIIVAALLILFIYKESRGYNIVEYFIDTDKDINPFRFVMLSDLHDTDVTHDKNKGLIASIKEINPDFVILAGDMITSYKNTKYDPDVAFDFLKDLSSLFTVYYGLGNHEQRYMEEPQRYPAKFERIEDCSKEYGIELLSDRYVKLDDRKICIYGFNVPIDNYRRGVKTHLPEGILSDVFGDADEEYFNILIAHHPVFFDEYVKFHPDLVLSGHLHGGIVSVPGIGGVISPQLRLFPKYDFGTFKKDKTTMIVSRGIGWHGIPIRIFNKAEIVSVTVGQNKREN